MHVSSLNGWRSRETWVFGASVAATLLICTGSATARAQTGQAQEGEFSVQRFEPAAGPHNYLSVAGARTGTDMSWSAGLMFDYQRNPFVITSCVSATNCDDATASGRQDVAVVQDMMTWNVLGSFTPISMVQIGLRVPVVAASGSGIDFATGGPAPNGLSAVGVGDINLEGKLRFIGDPSDLITLAAALDVGFPTGHASAANTYIGNDSAVAVGGRLIADVSYEGLTAAANLRGIWRESSTFGDSELGPEFRWGAAGGYQFHEMFRGIVELFGATGFSGQNGENSLEIDAGLQIMPMDGRLVITAAGGTGIIKGIGVPVARAILGVGFMYEAADDDDGDGIANDDDQCPNKAEDKDGVADSDGCPEDDYDRDNIPDEVDSCPTQAETENGYKDGDGCPDTAIDTDGDGIGDDRDKCPKLAGKMRRAEFFGCPDADKDGVTDKTDQCPEKPEDTDGFEDTDGCPDPDNDGDGILDAQDECSNEPETKNGFEDTDGCPDEPKPSR